jgi:hypothetical protein
VVPQHQSLEVHHGRQGGAPANAEYGWADPAGPEADWSAGGGYRAPNDYDMAGAEPGWVAALVGQSPEDWQYGQDWGAPPELHPDHPSAPVPRIRFPEDNQPWTSWAPRPPASPGPDGAGSRPSSASAQDLPRRRPVTRRPDGPGYRPPAARPPRDPVHPRRPGRHAAAAAPDQLYREAERELGPGFGDSGGFRRQARPARPDVLDYRHDTGPADYRHDTGPADYRHDTGPYDRASWPASAFRNGRLPSDDSAVMAGDLFAPNDGQAARIAQEAQANAAAIREAAEREAAAIREGAEREAAELRGRLDALLGDLSRVVGAYITDGLATPKMLTATPTLPDAPPALPGPAPALPGVRKPEPGTRPAQPKTVPTRKTGPASQPHEHVSKPGTRTAKPSSTPRTRTVTPDTAPRARPDGPARQAATPLKKGQAAGRQRRAVRVATYGTAALLSIVALGGLAEIGAHGFSFFVFREGGQGETPGNFHDTNFLARQARQAAEGQHHDAAPKGRHHKVA